VTQGLSDALDLKPANVTTAGRIEGQRQLFTLTEDVVTSHGGLYHVLRQGMMAHRAGKTRL
jgi:hypothetical protein